jgi:hypothetical protein
MSRSGYFQDGMPARIGPWLSDVLERHRLLVLLLFGAVLFATTAIRARAKPFWHDEIYTVLHSTLPSVSAMWVAALDGLDLAPPPSIHF